MVLDKANPAVYKQLYRAAKAKQKLKLRVTIKEPRVEEQKEEPESPSGAGEAENDARPSVEPADAERVADEPVISNSTPTVTEEQPSAPPAPAPETTRTAEAEKDGEAPSETPVDAAGTAPPVQSDTTTSCTAPASAPAAAPEPAPASTPALPVLSGNYAVCCNSCDQTIPDAHYHCSTCDDGDFDLCQSCVDHGITCKGPNHWLIKRFVRNGAIINSTTERLAPKPKPKTQPAQPIQPAEPLAPAIRERIVPLFGDVPYPRIRTCNCCVLDLPEVEFVHCTTCDDYDLCRACFAKDRHGHHPMHAFEPAVKGTKLEPEVARRLAAGRGQPHSAICDCCDERIHGVRHKCLDCPDWDYCSNCVVNASLIHPGHRFVPVYERIEPRNTMSRPVHFGICCDGPLCATGRATYIVGDRYKCAVCDDTDFCASCEASPANTHNRTHPLIKFKTPVRHVSVTTTGENENGRQMPVMGDRCRSRQAAADSPPAEARRSPSLSTNVQTVVDVKPSEPAAPAKPEEEEKGVQVKEEQAEEKPPAAPVKRARADDLFATFIRDTVPDGTVLAPDHVFEQTWVLRNTGKVAWPSGCSVKFVGGDYMGHLDSNHPAATRDVEGSCESPACESRIEPGEEHAFTVLLRTPHRTGRFVSNWRLTTKEGVRFGHRLWCDIVVEKPKAVPPPPAVTIAEPSERGEENKEAAKAEPEVPLAHSQMIFPKLDKESPGASVHEAPKAEPVSLQEEVEEYEDCEDDEWNVGEGESEEGFLTDEEYDILDASDEEFSLDGRPKQK